MPQLLLVSEAFLLVPLELDPEPLKVLVSHQVEEILRSFQLRVGINEALADGVGSYGPEGVTVDLLPHGALEVGQTRHHVPHVSIVFHKGEEAGLAILQLEAADLGLHLVSVENGSVLAHLPSL